MAKNGQKYRKIPPIKYKHGIEKLAVKRPEYNSVFGLIFSEAMMEREKPLDVLPSTLRP